MARNSLADIIDAAKRRYPELPSDAEFKPTGYDLFIRVMVGDDGFKVKTQDINLTHVLWRSREQIFCDALIAYVPEVNTVFYNTSREAIAKNLLVFG